MPEGVELGAAFVPIRADLGDFKKDLQDAHSHLTDVLGGFAKVAAVGAAGIAAAVVGIGVAAFNIGSQFDEAFDSIRVATGKTGDSLAGLQNDFRAVAAQVPDDFGAVSSAIGELNQRTGQTGEGLQGLAKQVLDFSRVTGTDVSANVQLATRLFGDWSVATDDQAGTLDKMFRASQATGIGVDELMGKVVQFGAPLRAMGFSLDESAAMLGKWEKEGVNGELVLGSLRIAMGNFARDNVPMREGLEATIASITAMGPGAEATSLAMQTFGARAGPDMAAAILEGRFALGDLLDVISNGEETVAGAAADTADFAEKWSTFTNRAKLAAEPLANAVFGLAGDMMDRLAPALEALLAAAVPLAIAFTDRLLPAVDRVLTVGGEVAALLSATLGPALAVVADFVGEHLQPILAGLATALAAIVIPAFAAWAIGAAAAATATVIALAPVLIPVVAIGAAVALLKAAWDSNWGDIQGKTAAVWAVIEPIFAGIVAALARFWEEVAPAFAEAWAGMTKTLGDDLEAMRRIVEPAVRALVDFWSTHWDTISRVLGTTWDVMTLGVRVAWEAISGLIVAGLQLLGGDWRGAWDTIKTHFGNVWTDIQGTFNGAIETLKTVMRAAGPALLGLLREGIQAAWGGVVASVQEGAARVAALLPHSWADEGPLSIPTDWTSVIVSNLPSRLDFARAAVQTAAADIATTWQAAADDMGDATQDMTAAVDDFGDSVDPISDALAALATQLLTEIATANAYTAALNAIPTSITTTVSTTGTGAQAAILNGGGGSGGNVSPGGHITNGGSTQVINLPGSTTTNPDPNIHHMALGGAGIATHPTMFLAGENGPEPFAFGAAGLRAVGAGGGSDGASGDVYMDGEKVGRVVWRFLKGQATVGVNLGFS